MDTMPVAFLLRTTILVTVGSFVLSLDAAPARQQQSPAAPAMSFFITSIGRGFGGDLGGLAGADAHCQQLATAVGHGNRVWRAYLSAPPSAGRPAVHARDRIGKGPWVNAKGVQVASSVADLHSDGNALNRDNSISEKGTVIAPGRHDILTGTNVDGTLATEAPDSTCEGWTCHGTGHAMLGHHNRSGGGQRPTSWNSAHLSRGCSQVDLRASLGDALLYCFAAD
jgi:hypothetical protein